MKNDGKEMKNDGNKIKNGGEKKWKMTVKWIE